MRVRLDEADPIERRIKHKVDDSDENLVGVEYARESHRSQSLHLGSACHESLNPSGNGTPDINP
jgi:hypothetical protein